MKTKTKTAGDMQLRMRRFLLAVGLVLTLLYTAVLPRGQVFAAALPEEEGFTVELSMSIDGEADPMTTALLQGTTLKVTGGPEEDGSYLVNVGADMAGMSLVDILVKIGSEGLLFQIPQTGDTVYQISLEKLGEIGASLFEGMQQGYQLGGTDELSGETGGTDAGANDLMGGLGALLSGPDIDMEQASETLAPYISILTDHIMRNTEVSEDVETELRGLGETVTVPQYYTYEPSAAEIEALMNDLADQMEDDTSFYELISRIADYIRCLNGILTTTDLYGNTMDANETADALEEFTDQLPAFLRENAAAAGQALEDVSFRVNVGLDNLQEVYLAEVTADNGQQDIRAAFEMMNGGDTNYYYYAGAESDGVEAASASGAISADDSRLKAEEVVSVSGEETVRLDYDFDLSDASFILLPYGSASLNAGGALFGMEVAPAQGRSGDVITLSAEGLDKLQDSYQDPYQDVDETAGVTGGIISMLISKENNAAAPEGTIVDISNYTQEEFQQLLGELGGQLSGTVVG